MQPNIREAAMNRDRETAIRVNSCNR